MSGLGDMGVSSLRHYVALMVLFYCLVDEWHGSRTQLLVERK